MALDHADISWMNEIHEQRRPAPSQGRQASFSEGASPKFTVQSEVRKSAAPGQDVLPAQRRRRFGVF